MDGIVSITDMSFSYRDWLSSRADALCPPVLSHVDLALEDGSMTLILAPPDAGKTTLARILAGLIPKYMDGALSGTVMVDGHDLSKTEPWELVHCCGYVSQNPLDELIAPTCEDEIAFPLESLGMPRYEIIRHVRAALEAWGLVSMREASAQELSGGERKRLLLAVQDAVDPKVWILDESFDDLDVSWRERLMDRISSRSNTSVVFGSRYLDEFHGTFDRYGLLAGGRLSFGDEADIALEFERLCETPYAASASKSVPGFIPVSDAAGCGRSVMPLHVMEREGKEHRLSCTDVSAVHMRRSMVQERPFTLSVPRFSLLGGEVVSLCGPNGSGKSTFSRLLCGLDLPLAGTFSLDDDVASRTVLNRSVGYLFQNPDYQIFLPTVKEELAWSLKRAKIPQREIDRRVGECADLFHLDLDETPSTMSFGLRKSLQAATYYLLDRPFYILDELDSALTYATAFDLVNLLRHNGAGILLITHDRRFADALADRNYTISDGLLSEAEEGA
ncbi:MAG: ATP-binding cassette domain-containing protein [Sphaerochaetaceae bacterium]|jgi:energy-coupling factor transport system ATP-binding protein